MFKNKYVPLDKRTQNKLHELYLLNLAEIPIRNDAKDLKPDHVISKPELLSLQ
jgi:hypothetical protein